MRHYRLRFNGTRWIIQYKRDGWFWRWTTHGYLSFDERGYSQYYDHEYRTDMDAKVEVERLRDMDAQIERRSAPDTVTIYL